MIIHLTEVHFAKMIESNQKTFHLSVQQSNLRLKYIFPLGFKHRFPLPAHFEACGRAAYHRGMPLPTLWRNAILSLSTVWSGVRLCRLLEVHWAGAGQGVHSQYLARPTWHSAPAAAAGPPKTLQPPQPAMNPGAGGQRPIRFNRSRWKLPSSSSEANPGDRCPPSRDGDIKISCGYSQLFSCLRLRGEKGSDDVNGVWPGATTQHSTHWQDGKKEIQLKTFRIYYYGKHHNTILQNRTVPKSKPWANNY